MKLSTEIRKEIEEFKNSIKSLREEGKTEEAYNKLAGLKDLENKLKEAELEETLAATNKGGEQLKKNKIDINTVFNKLVLGKAVTEEEMSVYNSAVETGQLEKVDEKGGFIVPPNRFNEIIEAKRKRMPLKDFCNVIPVSSNHGTLPTSAVGNAELKEVDELNEILESDEKFGELKFETKDYGDIVKCSNSLLEDTNVDLVGLIKRRFVIKSVNIENRKIMEIMETAEKIPGTTWEAILTTLNVNLDPAISDNAMIFTNQTSFDWLDKIKDADGKPLLTPDLTNAAIMRFRGRRIVKLPDTLMKPGATMDFFIGDLEEAISFFDRKAISIALSKEAGFTRNATLLRAMERFDVISVDKEALKKVVITPAEAKKK